MKISIVTVNLNNAAGLAKTLESVASQQYSSFEHVVADGGSTDGSVAVLERGASSLTWWVSEKDGGVYQGMNKAAARARGEYLLFLNSGDVLADSHTLAEMSGHLDGTDIVYGNMRIDDGKKITDGWMPDYIDARQMVRDTLWHPVSFIRRQVFEQLGPYDTSLRIVADYDFFFKALIAHQSTQRHVQRFVAVFDLHGMSSHPANVAAIREERDRVQLRYVDRDTIARLREPEKKSVGEKLRAWFRSS